MELKCKYKVAEAELEIFVGDTHYLREYKIFLRLVMETPQNRFNHTKPQNICMEKGIQNKEKKHSQHTMQKIHTAKTSCSYRCKGRGKLFIKKKQAWVRGHLRRGNNSQ